jgi:hypothetical protein
MGMGGLAMEYEVIVTHFITADSHEEAERKYRDNDMDVDQHQIYWYDEEGNRIEIPEETYHIDD